jgi:hypothetical protein
MDRFAAMLILLGVLVVRYCESVLSSLFRIVQRDCSASTFLTYRLRYLEFLHDRARS